MNDELKVVLTKIKELSLELIKAIDVLINEPSDAPSENKEEKRKVSLTEVRTVLAGLSRDGFTSEVKELLKKYGADKLSSINENDYEALLNDAEVLKEKEGK